jgi:outer membrane protein assembly factor BamB
MHVKILKILLISTGLIINEFGFSQSNHLYTLFHNPSGLTFGTLNSANGTYAALSETFCFSAYWATLDPVNEILILKGQVLPDQSTSKLYTIDLKTGAVIHEVKVVDGNEGIQQVEYNSCNSTLYALFKNESGVTLGKLNNADGTYSALSLTLCFGSFWSAMDPVHGHLIFKGQVFPDQGQSKLYTVDLQTGNIIYSFDVTGGIDGIRQMEYNPADSILYALFKDDSGIRLGKLNNLNGTFTALSGKLGFSSYWSALDRVNGHFIFLAQEFPGQSIAKLYTVELKTGNIIHSVDAGVVGESIMQMESGNNYCSVKSSTSTTSLSGKISIFPNPANDRINISLEESFPEISLIINDICGRSILFQTFKNQRNIQISLKNYRDGIYFIRIHAKDTESLIKVIKQGY